MTQIVDLQRSDDPRDVIHLAVQALAEGGLVGLPTENGYFLAALATHAEAVRQLTTEFGPTQPFLLLRGPTEMSDYAPRTPAVGARLAKRCWPGPVVLAAPAQPGEGLLAALPESVATVLTGSERILLRLPQHDVPQAVQGLLPAPLLGLDPLAISGTIHRKASDLAGLVGERVALIIDDGPSRYPHPPTVVDVTGSDAVVEYEGVVKASTVQRLAGRIYLFVCTGNTCRSPMAEALFRKLLSDRLGCVDEQLIDRGYVVTSAGVAAALGAPASPEAVEVLGKRGVDLSAHSSQPLSRKLFAQVDRVWTLTRQHRDVLLRDNPEAAGRVELLARDGSDISDPIGGGMNDYVACANEIERHVQALVEEVMRSE
jgi:L-threonylcarbamoyladenylate synthase